MLGWPVFAATGTMMIFQDMPWIPWLIHGFAAFIVTPTMLGHIYMATVNPETRTGISGMISGYVDRQWAKHHYARWYREELIGSVTRKSADLEVKKKSVGQTVELRKDPQFD